MMIRKLARHSAVVMSAAALSIFAAVQADAHANLVSVVPAADSTVASPKMIQVHFDEAIETTFSSLKLTTSDGTAIPVMSMNDAKDKTTLSIMPNSALKPGLYTVMWSVVSDDGHKEKGSYKFTVK